MAAQLSVDTVTKPQKSLPPAAIKLLTPKEAAELYPGWLIHNLLHRRARADLAETQKLELINSAQGVVAAFHSGFMSALGQKRT